MNSVCRPNSGGLPFCWHSDVAVEPAENNTHSHTLLYSRCYQQSLNSNFNDSTQNSSWRRGHSCATVSYCAALLPLFSAIQQRDGTSVSIVEDGGILRVEVFWYSLLRNYLYEELDMIGTITSVFLTFHHVKFPTLTVYFL